MELKNYIQILIRWIWFLLLFTLVGAGSGIVFSRIAKPTYQATTKILISKDLSDQNSQFASLNSQQLIDAYVQLLSSASVVDEVSHRLNSVIDIQNIAQIQQVRTTPVIQIVIEDSDPQRAAIIANTLVEVLIDQNTQASGYQSTEASLKNKISQIEDQISTLQTQFNQISDEKLQSQLGQVNDQIMSLQGEISKLSGEIGPLASLNFPTAEQSAQLAEKQAQLAQLQSLLTQYQQVRINLEYFGKSTLGSSNQSGDLRLQLLQSTLDHYQTIYLGLLDNLQTVQLAHSRNASTIEQIEKATPPAKPVRPRPVIYSMLAGVVGLMLAVGVVFIIEYVVDDTLKTPQDIEQAFDAPVFGNIASTQLISTAIKDSARTWKLYSETSETVNTLRTNLEFAAPQPSLNTLLLLGIDDSGKAIADVAIDLAISYAQSGSSTLLLDTDLRNPSIHGYFGLTNENGFSDLLAGEVKPNSVSKKIEGLDGLTIITCGNAPSTPLIEGTTIPNRVGKVLESLKKLADVIIIVAPSISVADAWVLASKVDGVLLVLRLRHTHSNAARHVREQLHRARSKMLGTVIYRAPHNLAHYYKSILNFRKRS